ncbi:hypothetical protein KC333_g9202 [Hortaea werneckii]|nr:hypothetical protein KC333_g9202 [Hortaea werneckii]KAI7301361.1 hypothetical protein KC326_g9170 [Hortaea werneckii]
MPSTMHSDDPAWPPGTVRLQDSHQSDHVVLQPKPSNDLNDPLVSTFSAFERAPNDTGNADCIDVATPTWAPMHEELGYSYGALNDSYAAGTAGLAVGAVILMPFALKYGRRPIYLLSSIIQTAMCIWSACQSTVADLILFNVISCFVGALAETIVQLTIADVFFVTQRGTMNAFYYWSTRVGAQLAPLIAGVITTSLGWRWVWWIVAIIFGLLILALFFGYEETKFGLPAVDGMRPETPAFSKGDLPNDAKHVEGAKIEMTGLENHVVDPTPASFPPRSVPRKPYIQRLAIATSSPGSFRNFFCHTYQPFQILFLIPGVFYMSLVYGAIMVTNNILVTTMSTYMAEAPYSFGPDQIGLMSLAPFIGSTLGTLLAGPLSDWWISFCARRNRGIYEPEMRLWLIVIFAIFLPIGMICFGVGLSQGWSWPLVAFFYGLCAFAVAPAGTLSLTYMTDAYTEVIGDAMVGLTFVRNLCSTVMIFAKEPWIAGVGLQNAFIMMAVILSVILFGNGVIIAFAKQFRLR